MTPLSVTPASAGSPLLNPFINAVDPNSKAGEAKILASIKAKPAELLPPMVRTRMRRNERGGLIGLEGTGEWIVVGDSVDSTASGRNEQPYLSTLNFTSFLLFGDEGKQICLACIINPTHHHT